MSKNGVAELSARELVDKYSAMIYRLAYARLQSNADAEDVTQEVLLRYIRADRSFNDEEHRKAWLLKATVNVIKTLVSSAHRRHDVELEEASGVTYEQQEPSGVKEAVAQLPEKYKVAIHLFYFEQLTIEQISKILNKSQGTVKSLLSRGRDKLRELLSEEGQYV